MVSQFTSRRFSWAAAIVVVAIGIGGSYWRSRPVLAQHAAPAGASNDRTLRWPLPATDKAYGAIDGDHLKGYVNEIVELTKSNRQPGSQYWGRITGSPTDAKMREWVAQKFKTIGLQNVEIEPFDLVKPQWFPHSWDVTAVSGSDTLKFASVFPMRDSANTPSDGLDLQPVWLGLGTAADFVGRDVRGKAAVIYSQPLPSVHNHTALEFGAVTRARDAGAASILIIVAVPGNFQYVRYLSGPEQIPMFMMGMNDGLALRKMIETGKAVKIKVKLDVAMVPGMKSGTVWGTLKGRTDEEILIMAHRDGFFEGAGDNASGVAAMLGLAEYFSKVPEAQRRRTIRFMAATGHHMIGPTDVAKLHENRATRLAKTVLILNGEHVGWTQDYVYGMEVRKVNNVAPLRWFINGSDRLKAATFDAYGRFGVSTLEKEGPGAAGDAGPVSKDVPTVGLIQSPIFFHSDLDTPGVVAAATIEAVARAFAKIVDEANKMERGELASGATRTSAEGGR